MVVALALLLILTALISQLVVRLAWAIWHRRGLRQVRLAMLIARRMALRSRVDLARGQ